MLDTADIVIAVLAFLAGSTVVSATGFGLALVASPILLLTLDPQTTVVTINTVLMGIYLVIILQDRAHLRMREMTPLTLAGLVGVPGGVYILSQADAGVLRVSISVLVLLLAGTVAYQPRGPIEYPRAAGPPVGFAVGSLVTSVGVGGPLLVLFLLGRGWPRHTLRVSLALYFLLVNATGVAGYVVAGMYTVERIKLILIVVISALLGFRLGIVLLSKLDESAFRKAVFLAIIVGSLMVLGREALRLQGAI